MSRFYYQHQDDLLVTNELKALKNNIEQMVVNHCYEKIVLVTLQPGLDYLYPNNFLLGEFVYSSFIDVLDSRSDILWLIRIHPIQFNDFSLRNRIINFFSKYKNVEVINSTKAALPALFIYVNGHLTWNSNVVTEASWTGVHSFIMDTGQVQDESGKSKSPYYAHIEERNLAVRAQNEDCAHEIKLWLDTLGEIGRTPHVHQFCIESFISEIGVNIR